MGVAESAPFQILILQLQEQLLFIQPFFWILLTLGLLTWITFYYRGSGPGQGEFPEKVNWIRAFAIFLMYVNLIGISLLLLPIFDLPYYSFASLLFVFLLFLLVASRLTLYLGDFWQKRWLHLISLNSLWVGLTLSLLYWMTKG